MKINKNFWLGNITLGSTIAPLFVISCSLFPNGTGERSKLEFQNFELYMNDENKKIINKYYHYNEFGDLPEFEKYLDDGISIGGISNDYFNAKLAGKGKITKIDFSRVYGITSDKTKWEKELQRLYTTKVWNALKQTPVLKMDNHGNKLFRLDSKGNSWTKEWSNKNTYYDKHGQVTKDKNKAVSHDVDGDGIEDKLWEFMIPYFFQNKVVAFNPYSFTGNSSELTKIKNVKNQAELNKIFENSTFYKQDHKYSYANILRWLKSLGGNRLTVNNYMRDNAIIGSEGLSGSNVATGIIADKNKGIDDLNNFESILQRNWKNNGGKINTFSTDGTKILMDLNRVASQPDALTDVAIVYNGDALDAYMAGEWDDGDLLSDSKKQIRVLTPTNSSSTIDGVVLSSLTSTSEREKERFYTSIKNALYEDVNKDSTKVSDYTSKDNLLFQNYDLIQYTPPFKYLYDYLSNVNNYFQGDQLALDIMNSAYSSQNVLTITPISDDLTFILTNYNDDLTRNLQN